METVFIIMIGILILLAISDLIVGVSNDAVNFLVSAIGSNAAPFRIIMAIAGAGVLFGATFSSGMMEVARKGIFNPQLFTFEAIMVIFLAVMLTDVILLDLFNSMGLPTSTTVSIVFELLGAAVAVAIISMNKQGESLAHLGNYINSSKALAIIAGILLSVVVAFSVGALIQFLSRLLFSFRYETTYKKYGALWGSIAITSIVYFILIKGLKGTEFAGPGSFFHDWADNNLMLLLLVNFVFWAIVLALLQFFTKFNILKIIILVGTFSLAMAFAGNDLVNFIGVPLAGLSSYKAWAASGVPHDEFMMTALSKKVPTGTLYLLAAGSIMVITLWLSKKAKKVTQTSIDLSRQKSGQERFEANTAARAIVRSTIGISNLIYKVVPMSILKKIEARFELPEEEQSKSQSFDLIRAAVNLMVAGILISLGTSMKLPLSTTYVTFMVAMGSSLADKAWGRESAVYRVSGVLIVISGWFITALVAFTAAFIFANIINWGGLVAALVLLMLAGVSLVRSQFIVNKREKKEKEEKQTEKRATGDIFTNSNNNVINLLSSEAELFEATMKAFADNNRKELKNLEMKEAVINKRSKHLKDNLFITVQELESKCSDSSPFYVQVLDFLREVANSLHYVVKPIQEHVANQHKAFLTEQYTELNNLATENTKFMNLIITAISQKDFSNFEKIKGKQEAILNKIQSLHKMQVKRIKNKQVGTRNSILYFNLIGETKNILNHALSLTKSHRDFINTFRKKNK